MKTFLLFFLVAFKITGNAQTAVFKYQYENQQARAGHFSFKCSQDTTLNFEADASAGYLGAANNPYMQATVNAGPIPNGTWIISSIKNTDKVILRLTPEDDVNITDRDGFLIHGQGENETPAESSTGCIILSREFRQKLMKAFQNYGAIQITVTNFTTSDPTGNG